MTSEEFLRLPCDGAERWLVRGEMREQARPHGVRDRYSAAAMARAAYLLGTWQRAAEAGTTLLEAGFLLGAGPDTLLAPAVAVVSAAVLARQASDSVIEGEPVLAVEILSPGTRHGDLHEKIDAYLAAGTALVWVVNPSDRTVRIYQAGAEPAMVNATQQLDGGPHLPGFCVPVAQLFA